MLALRKSDERGHAQHGWLDSYHSFSFADYYDPAHTSFSALRVINEDWIAPAAGFPMHGHRDMEIITYLLEGALQHRDSMGNGSIIRPGDVQRMSAGTGVTHSEFNPDANERAHLLQIWIQPDARGVAPSYEQRAFSAAEKRGRLRVIASPDGRNGSVTIHQDAYIYASVLRDGDEVAHRLAPGRKAYVHVASGELSVNGELLYAGDAAKLSDEGAIHLRGDRAVEVLLFDLP